MKWILVAGMTTALLAGCRGGGESAEPRASESTDGGQATGGDGSLWGAPGGESEADRPRAGTGSVAEQQAVVEGQGGSGNGVYEFGQQIEAEEPEQLGIADGELASLEGQNISVRRPDGETVEMLVDDDALVVMEGAPVDPNQLTGLTEGTPIRAEYSLEEGQNIARRIEVPVRASDPEPESQQPAPDDRAAGESGPAPAP